MGGGADGEDPGGTPPPEDVAGIDLDDDFPDRLIEHNQKLLSTALRAHSETA